MASSSSEYVCRARQRSAAARGWRRQATHTTLHRRPKVHGDAVGRRFGFSIDEQQSFGSQRGDELDDEQRTAAGTFGQERSRGPAGAPAVAV